MVAQTQKKLSMKINLFSRYGRERNFKMYNGGNPTFSREVKEVFFCEGHLYFTVASLEEANSLIEDLNRFSKEPENQNPFQDIKVQECENGKADVSMGILPHVRWSITD